MPGCDNCFYKSPAVGTKGPEDSPFVIVGESAGINEVVQGLPFVGASGVVIHEALERANISSTGIEPYFTNAISCLPRLKDPQNLAAACLQCRPRLLAELRKHPRKVILALGAASLQTLTGNFELKITKERGKLLKSEFAEIGIIPAVHPAFLLRGAGNYTQFQRDIDYAVNLVRDGESARKLPSGTSYEVIHTPKDVSQFIGDVLDKLPEESSIGSDIETTGFNYQTDSILCVGLQYHPKKSVIINNWDYNTRTTTNVLSQGLFQERLKYTWHNGKFDCRFLRFQGLHTWVDDDTMLLSYALNERRGIHDLDQAASDWLGSPNHKHLVDYIYKTKVIDPITLLPRKGNLSDLPQELLWKYLALDINDTYHLKDELEPQVLQDKDLRKFYRNHLIPGSEYLLRLELNGMLVDQEVVEANHWRLKAEMDRYRSEFNGHGKSFGLIDVNPNSPKQVKTLLYEKLKLGSPALSTDKDTIETLYAETKHPALRALRNYRIAAKSHGTYVKPLLHGPNREILLPKVKKESVVYPDGRTHSSYLLHGTPTSRLACRDDNAQNIPRDPRLRGQRKARDGYIILECDYSQAELRSLAALSQCTALMEIFISGKDLHNEFSSFLFGPNFTREEKMAAKTVNFGIPYGREAPSIAADPQLNTKMDVTIKMAQSWIDGWAERFPGAWEFIQKCRMAPIRGETITTCFGNKKRPGVVSREKLKDLQNESANFPHQSIASNLTVRSGIELIDVLELDYDTYIINTVHDCIVMETPLNMPHIHTVANLVMNKMREIPTRFKQLNTIPWKAEAEVGVHWGNLYKLHELKGLDTYDLATLPRYVPAH
jgi:uracil-DNA glycosylase family 4